jgi:hypothetical protein
MPKPTSIEKFAEDIETSQRNFDAVLAHKRAVLAWLKTNETFWNELDAYVDICGIYVDINHPTREQKSAVMFKFPGAWRKDYNHAVGTIHYTLNDVAEGINLRLFGAPPPPSCKVVKTFATVPEHTETVYKIECEGRPIEDVEE